MSASSKKKLRKEQNAALLTERQQKEQAEAKKLKVTSVIFIAIMAVVVVTALTVMAITGVQNSGVLEKNTVVATVGEHKINAVEANYYFGDMISSTYSEWNTMYGEAIDTYMSFMGLDLSLPLNEQYYDEDVTWSDYFLESALDQAKADYALYDQAMAEGFTLSEDDQSVLDSSVETMGMYAMLYGNADADDYLRAMYGNGSNMKTYREYAERSAIASAYYNAHNDSLSYDDTAIRAYEADKYNDFSSYSYANYYIATSKFEGDNAADEAKKVAESLLTATNVDDLDSAIAALEINADVDDAHSTQVENGLFTSISSIYRDWLADSSRKENDIELFANEVTSTDTDGNETTTVNGYYVVMFQGSTDNAQPMSNVRHLLVEHSHAAGEEHSDHDMEELKAEADGYLETWLAGDKTEESFIELVKEHSDDTSAATGGLFEDINPSSNYVPSFLNWSIDPDRKAGDCEVIESEYGYHVMYYVGNSEMTYRDYMISNEMRAADLEAWHDGIVDTYELTILSTSRVNLDRIISPA